MKGLVEYGSSSSEEECLSKVNEENGSDQSEKTKKR